MCVYICTYTEKIDFKVNVLFMLLREKDYGDISNEYLMDIIFLTASSELQAMRFSLISVSKCLRNLLIRIITQDQCIDRMVTHRENKFFCSQNLLVGVMGLPLSAVLISLVPESCCVGSIFLYRLKVVMFMFDIVSTVVGDSYFTFPNP